MEHHVNNDTNHKWSPWNDHKEFGKKDWESLRPAEGLKPSRLHPCWDWLEYRKGSWKL